MTARIDPAATGSVTNTATITPPADVDDPTPGNNTSSLTLPLVPSTVINVFKTDGSEVYNPGGHGTYLVTVTNLGPSDALDVGISDPLPPGVTLSGPATCTAVGNATCGAISGTTGDSAVVATGGRIAAGLPNSLLFLVPVGYAADLATDPIVNTVTATDAASGGSGVSSDTDGRLPGVALAVGVDDGSPTYTPGGTGTVTVTVMNANGVSDALDVSVVSVLPTGVTVAGQVTCAANNHATCGAISGGAAGGASFGLSGAFLGAGAGNALVLVVPMAYAGSLTTNPLVITATATDAASGSSATGSDSDTPVANVALTLSKSDGTNTYRPGGTGTYTIVVANAGLSDALGVSLTDTLPAGVTLAGEMTCSATGNASCGTVTGAPGGSTFGASGARVGGGAGNRLTFIAPVAFATDLRTNPLVNTATATDAASGSSATSSDSDTPAVNVALTLSKSDGTNTYRPGGNGTYTIVVGNAGLSNAAGVSLTDMLPAGVTLAGEVTCSAAGNASCGTVTGAPGGSTFGTSGARVGGGTGNRLTFVAPVAFAADLRTDPLVNTATATDAASGSSATSSDSDTPVLANVALTLSKSDGTNTYRPGGQGVYTIVVGNTGLSEALGVSLVDMLPAGVTLAGEVTCSAAGNASCGTVTGAPGGSTFGTSGARVGGGAGNTLTLAAPVAFAADLRTNPLVNTATVSDSASGSVATASDSDAREGQVVAVPAISPQGLALLVLFLLLSGITTARHRQKGNA